jgi:cytochrome c-type biogenesis protein CcmH
MRALLAAALLAFSGAVFAQATEVAKPDAQVERRLKTLAEELRCLVCQNQTIADSSAPLALDLRNQIRVQIGQGRSDDQIRDYMVTRYGDFVLYRPPFKATTLVLWVGPALLLALGIAVYLSVLRRRRTEPATPPTGERLAAIESLLAGDGDRKKTPPRA